MQIALDAYTQDSMLFALINYGAEKCEYYHLLKLNRFSGLLFVETHSQ